MHHRHAAILLAIMLTLVMFGVTCAGDRHRSTDAGERRGSHMYTDPDTGMTLLLPREHLPADFEPPPRTGPCDKEVRTLVENWQDNAKHLMVGLAVLGGAYGLFVLVGGHSR